MLNDLVQSPDGSPAFHVVAPSLIDFGFSSSSGNVSISYIALLGMVHLRNLTEAVWD